MLPVRGLTLTTLREANVDQLGIRTNAGIVNVREAAEALGIANPPSHVDDVVRGIGDVESLARIASSAPPGAILDESSVEYGPLVRKPEKILCVGFNYIAHIAEFREPIPEFPDLFNKFNSALNRHKGTIKVSHLATNWFDYESELVVIVGKVASNVREVDALDYVFGYTTGNDFTERSAQTRVSQWMTGKTPDQFAPIGPWLVTADQIPDPQTLQVQTFVNDESTPRQDMNTKQMIFTCAHILSYASQYITLQPGDVIFTGTPSGVIWGYPEDKRVWLKPGDRIRTVISNIGELQFSLV